MEVIFYVNIASITHTFAAVVYCFYHCGKKTKFKIDFLEHPWGLFFMIYGFDFGFSKTFFKQSPNLNHKNSTQQPPNFIREFNSNSLQIPVINSTQKPTKTVQHKESEGNIFLLAKSIIFNTVAQCLLFSFSRIFFIVTRNGVCLQKHLRAEIFCSFVYLFFFRTKMVFLCEVLQADGSVGCGAKCLQQNDRDDHKVYCLGKICRINVSYFIIEFGFICKI